jgi:GAF domain-containing protein/anti-sigma regulatory factor (Ser/Thr protein kinase)
VPDTEGEEPPGAAATTKADRLESRATWVALLWVSVVAVVDAVFGGKFGLIGFLYIAPFIAAAFTSPRRTALVALYATFFSVILSTPPRQYDQLNHVLRGLTAAANGGVAIWIAHLRTQRSLQLTSAHTETRNERRRRVAAETAQRMQAMARALTTAADPAQVADAVFGVLRDELHVDAATFATMNERGVLMVHQRFGFKNGDLDDAVLHSMEPDGAMSDVLTRQVALFAESIGQLRREWPLIAAAVDPSRFSALAVVPLVVSDRAVGVVIVHWVKTRPISESDKGFLFTITGAAAQAVERARLTLTEFANLERNQHLHHLSSALAAATTPADVARAAIAGGRRALGAHSAACRVPATGGRTLMCLASSGHPALLARRDVPVEGSPSGWAFTLERTQLSSYGVGEPIAGDTAHELLPRAVEELGRPVTIVTEPLLGSVGALGVLTFVFVAQPELSPTELRFLSTLAGLTAQALERAQLFEQERQALRDAEAGRDRLSLLSEVTRLLSSSLDPTTVMQRTMTLVAGRLADACVVQVPGENGLQRLDVRGVGPFASVEAQHLICPPETPFGCDAPAAIAYRTGRAQLAPAPSPFIDTDSSLDSGDSTALAVPLAVNGEVIGVMTFVDGPGRQFGPDDLSLAAEVASRTGVALSNATRFQREHVVAEVLQRAVLPDFLPSVAGLHLDAEYRAGAAGTYVGGDWYDVFQLGDTKVVFSVGDVMGKGPAAAALMGQVRSAIRAYAVGGQSPSEVLSSLDRLFDALVEDRLVTVVVGVIDPTSGAVQLANAGHPPPLKVTAEGETTFTTAPSSLLIAAGLGGPERPSQELQLSWGDTLVMYSDGLVERRGESITLGMDRLESEAAAVARAGWPSQPAAELATLLSDEECTDDVVVLALRYTGVRDARVMSSSLGTGRDGMSVLRLEPVVESTPMARHWVLAHLRAVPTEVAECAALLTSELVTNAVLHAATPLSVTLHMLADRIRIDVADRSPMVPSVKDYGADAATGRGLTLFDTLASDWGVQVVPGGKIVWFELPVDYAVTPSDTSDGNFRFDLIGIAHPELHDNPVPTTTVDVDLIGVPVALLQKASEEYEGLFRELRLMKERTGTGSASILPERLSVLVSEVGARFNGFGAGVDDLWQEVVDRGTVVYNWQLTLPQSAVAACEFYDGMLDEADEFGLSAHMLTLPASPTSVAVRRWFLSELIGQLHGKAPTAWDKSRFHADLMQRATSA